MSVRLLPSPARHRSRGMGDYDLCVIGSGPAGMTLLDEVVRRNPRVRACMLESGGAGASDFADQLRDLDSSGIAIEPRSRERVLGGTSSTWTGRSAPLDEIDLEERSWVRYSGWPIGYHELTPYYARAAERYRFPALSLFRTEAWAEVLQAGGPHRLPHWSRLAGKLFLAPRDPQHFGAELAHLFRSESVDLFLDATVVRIEGDPRSGEARAAVVRSSRGSERRIHARCFVLACGGIENARLLLLSTYACPRGLGNERDQVGRYLMNHPKGSYGVILPAREPRELPAYFGFARAGFAGSLGLRLTDAFQRENALLNAYLRLEPVFDWTGRPGVAAAAAYLDRWRTLPARLRGATARDPRAAPVAYAGRVRLIWRDRAWLWRYLKQRLLEEGAPPVRMIRLRNFMEMEPDPANRVRLGRRRDPFGNPVPQVHHEAGPLGRRTMQALHEVLREELWSAGWGELVSGLRADLHPWPLDRDASHHMGTTRMGRDPAVSVVDENCRIHSSPNVYLAGASLFPTGGNANPTFTIVALALRLAKHLADRLAIPQARAAERVPARAPGARDPLVAL